VPDRKSHRCVGGGATADAPDGASPPGDTGEARDDVTIAENDTSDSSGNIFHGACMPFGGLLACSFQRLWYAALMGRRRGRVVDPRS
jgi:hypothetical protein